MQMALHMQNILSRTEICLSTACEPFSVYTIIGFIDTHTFPGWLLRVEENTNQYNEIPHLGVQLAQLPLCWTLNLPVLTVELHLHESDKYQIILI